MGATTAAEAWTLRTAEGVAVRETSLTGELGPRFTREAVIDALATLPFHNEPDRWNALSHEDQRYVETLRYRVGLQQWSDLEGVEARWLLRIVNGYEEA